MATALVANPTGDDVAAWLGRQSDTSWVSTVGNLVAETARQAASAHCRGVGFESPTNVPADLSWVILMRAVRMAQNYSQLISEGKDSVNMLYGSAGQGWTLNEIQALDAYRRTAA